MTARDFLKKIKKGLVFNAKKVFVGRVGKDDFNADIDPDDLTAGIRAMRDVLTSVNSMIMLLDILKRVGLDIRITIKNGNGVMFDKRGLIIQTPNAKDLFNQFHNDFQADRRQQLIKRANDDLRQKLVDVRNRLWADFARKNKFAKFVDMITFSTFRKHRRAKKQLVDAHRKKVLQLANGKVKDVGDDVSMDLFVQVLRHVANVVQGNMMLAQARLAHVNDVINKMDDQAKQVVDDAIKKVS